MIGDVYLVRDHGGPGLRGWLSRQLHDMITLIKSGRHTGYGHVAVEVAGDMVLDAGFRGITVRSASTWDGERYSLAVVRRFLDVGARQRLVSLGRQLDGQRYSWPTFFAHLVGRRFAELASRQRADDVICSELAARLHHHSDGYDFRRRLTRERLRPGAVLPRDIEWTARQVEETWACVKLTSHGALCDPLTFQEV